MNFIYKWWFNGKRVILDINRFPPGEYSCQILSTGYDHKMRPVIHMELLPDRSPGYHGN